MKIDAFYSVSADLKQLHAMRDVLHFFFHKAGLPSKSIQELLLGITEWVTNLIKYADPKPQTIQFAFLQQASDTHLLISDDGQSFEHFNTHLTNARLDEEIHEGGYGLYLIKQLFPACRYIPMNCHGKNQFIVPLPIVTQKPHIVLIEDNRSVRQILDAFLQSDYEISEFDNGAEFLAVADELVFDLVISDISMPLMNGIELRQQLSEKRETDVIPFIFLTSNEDVDIENQAIDLGIDDYLHKPVTKLQLLSVVKRVLRRNKLEANALSNIFDDKLTAALKPELPKKIANFNCSVVSQAASAGGGDFIVHFDSADRNLIFLGDVMGHGHDAKFYAHMYAGYLQGLIHSLDKQLSVGHCLAQLSTLIRNDPYLESVIVTCLALSLEKKHHITIANAGHPKPILITDSHLNYVEVTGTLPGLEDSPDYQELTIDLTNNRLFAYTDGLFEIGKSQEERQSSAKRIEQLMQQPSDLNKTQSNLMEQVDLLSGNNIADDVTVIGLEAHSKE